MIIHCYKINQYFPKEMAEMFGGCECVEIESFDNQQIDVLMVYETTWNSRKERQKIRSQIQNGNVKKCLVFIAHPYTYKGNFIQESNDIDVNVEYFVQGHWDTDNFPNIKKYEIEPNEYNASYHGTRFLANILKSRRTPTKDFLLCVTLKDNFRKNIFNFIQNSKWSHNSILVGSQSRGLYGDKEVRVSNFSNALQKLYEKSICQPIIKTFGTGFPNFDWYEKCFCEIVLESSHTADFMITEKFLRPIMFNIPIVFLGPKKMFEDLKERGYRFYDDDFYDKWFEKQDLNDLDKFLQHIKTRPIKMIEIADHNYKNFWENRKIQYFEKQYEIWKQILPKENIYEQLYKEFNK